MMKNKLMYFINDCIVALRSKFKQALIIFFLWGIVLYVPLAIFNPLVFGFGSMVGGSSDVAIEDETGYETDFRISLADGQSWFGGDDLGSEAITAQNDRDFNTDIGNWTLIADGDATLTWNEDVIGGADDKQGKLVSNPGGGGASDGYIQARLNAPDWSPSANTLYKAIAKLYAPAANTNKDVRIGAYNFDTDVQTVATLVGNTWTELVVYFYIASDLTGVFRVMFDSSPADDDILYFDDISIKPVTSPADYADSGFLLQVTDGSGNKASGYVGERGLGQTLGGELLDNPSFDVNTTGWTPLNNAVLESVAGGVSNNALRITEGGGNFPNANQAITTVLNKQYKFGSWVKQGTFSFYSVRLETSGYGNVGPFNQESTATWVFHGAYGVASDIQEPLYLFHMTNSGGATTIFFDEASFKEVTEPNPNSVMIYKEPHLATEGWLSIDGSFDPNDIVSFIIFG